jgi:septum formation inhibitor-activating ATPase MinD
MVGLIVSSSDVTSIHGATLAAEGLSDAGVTQSYLLLNHFLPHLVKKKLAPNPDMICDQIGVQLLGILPQEAAVPSQIVEAKMNLNSPFRKGLERIARRLTGQQVPLPKLSKLTK